jgi:hypothetical protein
MAKDDGKPGDETLTAAFDELKRDGAAWFSAEQRLLQARFRNGVRRVELAILLAIVALMVTIAATVTLANMLVDMLVPITGAVLAGAIVAIALFIAGGLLIFWIRSLVHPNELGSRAKSHAKVIWSALNEPH